MPAVKPLVDIVIVNWNSREYLALCLRSIVDCAQGLVASVTVVDNASTDGSTDNLPDGLPLTVVHTGANLGFGMACNMGAERGEAPYVLFLNPDAALQPGTLQSALTFTESTQGRDVGVCGVKLIDESGRVQKHCARFPGPATMLSMALGLPGLLPGLFPEIHDTAFDHLSSRPVDHVIGAFYLIRRGVFEEVGGFDEGYFVYIEDLDLSLRVTLKGWKIHYLAEAQALHKGGGTSENVKAHRLFYALESRLVYANRHFGKLGNVLVVATTLLLEPWPRFARAILRRSATELHETARGMGWLWSAVLRNPGHYLGAGPAFHRNEPRRVP